MKLSKGETNELLYKISKDNQVYGLIYKLIYVYGKTAREVLLLTWNDIDLETNSIIFKDYHFPLLNSLKQDILNVCKEDEEYLFLCLDSNRSLDNIIDVYRKRLRYYLSNTVKGLDLKSNVKHSGLSITELRRLRGQHLLLDGVPLRLIRELYLQGEGTTTQFKRYIGFDELEGLRYSCEDMLGVFNAFTDLCIFDLEGFSGDLSFVVSDSRGDFECLVSITDDGLFFDNGDVLDDDFRGKILKVYRKGLLDDIGVLKSWECKLVGGLVFVRL